MNLLPKTLYISMYSFSLSHSFSHSFSHFLLGDRLAELFEQRHGHFCSGSWEMDSTADYIFTPCVGSVTSPGIDTR